MDLRRSVKPVDAEIAGLALNRLHWGEQIDVFAVAEEPRHVVDGEGRVSGKGRAWLTLPLFRAWTRQPSDIDDGMGGDTQTVLQRLGAAADRAQEICRRVISAVLHRRELLIDAVLDPPQDREGLAAIIGIDIGAQHGLITGQTGQGREANLALAERVNKEPATKKTRQQVALEVVAQLCAGALDDRRAEPDIRPCLCV